MADRPATATATTTTTTTQRSSTRPSTVVTAPTPTSPSGPTFLRRLQSRAPSYSNQYIGNMTLLTTGAILLFLAGITITVTLSGLVLFAPLIVITSPIWIPAVIVLFAAVAGFLTFCGLSVVVVAGLSWMYRYFTGMNPPGSERMDYARSRIYDTANHVKDYAREYGGYLQSKVKDAAPGA